jgi:hypothetical protein
VFWAASHLAVAVASEGEGLPAKIGRAAAAGADDRTTRRKAAAKAKRAGESMAISWFGCQLQLANRAGVGVESVDRCLGILYNSEFSSVLDVDRVGGAGRNHKVKMGLRTVQAYGDYYDNYKPKKRPY